MFRAYVTSLFEYQQHHNIFVSLPPLSALQSYYFEIGHYRSYHFLIYHISTQNLVWCYMGNYVPAVFPAFSFVTYLFVDLVVM
jgi:hypothetical protein